MRDVPDAELWVVGERLPRTAATTWLRCCATPASATGCACWAIATDVAALLAAADIFVLPSHFEGLPMSVIEAMLTGLPVVATDIRGPREQVVPDVTGLLVPPGNVAPPGRGAAPPGCGCRLRARDGRSRPRARALELTTRRRWWRGRWTCSGCRSIPRADSRSSLAPRWAGVSRHHPDRAIPCPTSSPSAAR